MPAKKINEATSVDSLVGALAQTSPACSFPLLLPSHDDVADGGALQRRFTDASTWASHLASTLAIVQCELAPMKLKLQRVRAAALIRAVHAAPDAGHDLLQALVAQDEGVIALEDALTCMNDRRLNVESALSHVRSVHECLVRLQQLRGQEIRLNCDGPRRRWRPR